MLPQLLFLLLPAQVAQTMPEPTSEESSRKMGTFVGFCFSFLSRVSSTPGWPLACHSHPCLYPPSAEIIGTGLHTQLKDRHFFSLPVNPDPHLSCLRGHLECCPLWTDTVLGQDSGKAAWWVCTLAFYLANRRWCWGCYRTLRCSMLLVIAYDLNRQALKTRGGVAQVRSSPTWVWWYIPSSGG